MTESWIDHLKRLKEQLKLMQKFNREADAELLKMTRKAKLEAQEVKRALAILADERNVWATNDKEIQRRILAQENSYQEKLDKLDHEILKMNQKMKKLKQQNDCIREELMNHLV